MSELPGIVITGASGRMGQMLIAEVLASENARLAGVVDREGHDWVGQDLGQVMGRASLGVTVSDNPLAVFENADVVIDFTSPAATVAHAKIAAEAGTAHIIGTTGLTDDDMDQLRMASARTQIVQAGNMSLGVNLLVQLTRKVAAALDEDFDIEIVETHHRHKVDAPSGTALMLGEAAADGRGVQLKDVADRGRDGITGARTRGDIGFVALRGGDVVGEHDAIFAADGERIVLRHVATDRRIFSRGALKAALWAKAQPPGFYDMLDVLNLK